MKNILLLSVLMLHFGALHAEKKDKKRKKEIVLIETSFGDMKLKLYDETPLHKENFLKLVEENKYDSTLFHRVIKDFMIQGGDPDSKRAKAGDKLGDGELGYTLKAEFVDSLFHKRGALAAARMGDDVNPEKESSSCQFYIVHGRKFAENDLRMMEKQMNVRIKNGLYQKFFDSEANAEFKERFIQCQQTNDQEGYKELLREIEPSVDAEYQKNIFSFSQEQIKAYSGVGGAPHLDGGYTVFGELIEGFDVLDKIANQETDAANRPLKDVRVQMKLVKR